MPLITLGDNTQKLKIKIPSKGDTNWSEDIKSECFEKIVDHDHTSYAGSQIPTAGIAADAINQSLVADDAIQVEHKFTDTLALTGGNDNIYAIATGASVRLTYRIKNSGTTEFAIGTIDAFCTGPHTGYIQDEFIGDDLSLVFDINTNQIRVNGDSGDAMVYSIEFKESAT